VITARRILAIAVLMSLASSAHDVITTPITYSREISRLIYSRCAGCHREGGAAFSLLSYQEARPWAKAIKEEVLERRMPPWGAVKGFGQFRDDRGLSQEQIELIADWVEGGAPEGDPALLPKRPDFPQRAAPPTTLPELMVERALVLKTPATLTGIRAGKVAEGASLMVTAARPDGSIEPLLWLYDYKPQFARSYWYNAALRLPAGTKIEVSPPDGGSVALLVRRGQ
jgi:hypothetical protein